jgi:hypothetical protein
LGYYVEVTERVTRITTKGGKVLVRRHDLHGFADAVALNGKEIVYLQPTSWGHVNDRLKKIQTEWTGKGKWRRRLRDIARDLLSTGVCRIVIEGWRMDEKTWRYELRSHEVTLEDLTDV